MLDDNKKIGMGLLGLSFLFISMGVLFLLDSTLIAIGDFLFLAGLVFIIGLQRTVRLFTKRDRAPGIICFFLGILLVFVRWTLIGLLLQIFGFVNLFGNFFPPAIAVMQHTPILKDILRLPGISYVVGRLGTRSRAPV